MGALLMPPGDLGTRFTVWRMTDLVRADVVSPLVRMTAVRIVPPGRDGTVQALALRYWLETHVQFIRDPDQVEMLHPPQWQVQQILTSGTVRVDCDDAAMLAAALGKAIGLQARFVLIGTGSSPSVPFRHIWAELRDPRGGPWLEMDVTRQVQALPLQGVSRMRIVPV